MRAEELRIGNYIYYSSEVSKDEIMTVSIGTFGLMLYNSDQLSPISLTEEWFEKFGFYKDDEYWSRDINDYKYCFKYRDWAKNWAFYQEFTDSPFEHDEGMKYPVSFDIEFVHQLQNLWFALQHEELTDKQE
jgi:hypothetical protein